MKVRRLVPLLCASLVLCLGVGCGRGKGGQKDGVVARIAGDEITTADVDRRIGDIPQLSQAEFSTPQGRARLVRQMVEEEVLYRAAVDDGLEKDPEVSRSLAAARRQILVQSYLDRAQARLTQVDEDEARKFYEKHKDEYRTERMIRVRLLITDNKRVAESARQMALDGQPFDEVCARHCTDTLAREAKGLLPGWIRRDKAVPWIGNQPAFHQNVFDLGAGEVSPVFETTRGFHVARVEEVREEQQRTFDEARADVEARIARERSTQGLPQMLDELKERYHAEVLEQPGRSAEELFAQAERLPDPEARIATWEELVELHPKDERVVEALFMIGFTKAEELKDPEGAKAAFQRVVDEFPESELAQSARWMLTSQGNEVPDFEEGSAEVPPKGSSGSPSAESTPGERTGS